MRKYVYLSKVFENVPKFPINFIGFNLGCQLAYLKKNNKKDETCVINAVNIPPPSKWGFLIFSRPPPQKSLT